LHNISFTSIIRPVTAEDYHNFTKAIPRENAVNEPWTKDETVIAKDVLPTRIDDCSALLITNGQDAELLHLCPTDKRNSDTRSLLNFLKNSIEQNLCNNGAIYDNTDLQAILIGSKNEESSKNLYEELLNFLKKFNIPVTQLKNGKSTTNIAYKTNTDTFVITNKDINDSIITGSPAEKALNDGFTQVSISEMDEIE